MCDTLCEVLTTPPTDLGTNIPGHSTVLVGQQLGQLAVFDEQLSHLRSTNILQVDITGQRLLFNNVNPLLWLNLVMEVQQLLHIGQNRNLELSKVHRKHIVPTLSGCQTEVLTEVNKKGVATTTTITSQLRRTTCPHLSCACSMSRSAIKINSLPSLPTQATKHASYLTKKGRESIGGAVATPQLFMCGRPDHRSVLCVGLFKTLQHQPNSSAHRYKLFPSPSHMCTLLWLSL